MRLTGAVTAGAVLAAFSTPARASEFVPGTGTSSATVARVQLRSSGTAIGVGLGEARTRFAGQQGNAEATTVDLGFFEAARKAPLACGYALGSVQPEGFPPPPVAVSSSNGPAEQHSTAGPQPGPLRLGTEYGAAAPNTSAVATAEGLSFQLPGLFSLGDGTASSAARLIPGSQRTATAGSSLASLTLAGGQVVLDGLRWAAEQRSGATTAAAGGFSVTSLTVAGRSYPTSDGAQLAAAAAAANRALAPTGLSLVLPRTVVDDQGVAVTPLRLTVVATPTVRAVVAATLLTIQPMRSQLLDFLSPFQAGADCGLAKALGFGYLLVDLASLALGEGGAVDVDLGGARAGTDGTAYTDPFGAVPPVPPPVPPASGAVGAPGPTAPDTAQPGTPEPSGGRVLAAGPAPAGSIGRSVSCRSTHGTGGSCTTGHGPLAAWSFLAVVGLLAGADRLRSRSS